MIWVFPKIMGIPKSSILIGFSIIFTIHFGVKPPIFGNTHIKRSWESQRNWRSRFLGVTAPKRRMEQQKSTEFGGINFFGNTMIFHIPSRELTYPTKREKENHRLKMPFLGDMLVPRRVCTVTLIYAYWCMQVKILFISTIWTSDRRTRKMMITINVTCGKTVVFPNAFSECFPRAGVWIIDDLRKQSVAPLTRCHDILSSLTLKGEGVRQQPNMKHFLELNRLILFTANFCLKVDLISGETGFLQEQFHSVYATDTLTCSSVKRMWLYYESKVYVPINSWMFKDSITTHWCSWISWIHFPHVLSQQNKTPWGAPGEAMVIATCREGWGPRDCQNNTNVHFGHLMNIGWNWTETFNYNVSSYFLWGRFFLHLLWTHLHNSPLDYGFCLNPRSLCKHVASKKFKVESRSRFTKAKVRRVGQVSSILIWYCIHANIYIYRKYTHVYKYINISIFHIIYIDTMGAKLL